MCSHFVAIRNLVALHCVLIQSYASQTLLMHMLESHYYVLSTQERAELTTPGPESGAYYGSIIQRSDGDNQRQNLEIFNLISYSHLYSMFYIVGLGLCDEKDITVRGLEVMGFFCC